MYSAALLALAATASAAVKGFNYGNTFTTGAIKQQSDYETEFTTAQNLVGAQDFTSARLYTMVQGGSTNDPIAAIPAAIKTKTSLLLGLWASGTSFPNELAALTRAVDQYGDDLASLVDGISVGSEDLYRNSPQGIAAGSNIGAEPATIIDYISQVRKALQGTKLSGAKIGHVDTWTAWVNGSNSAVADACDWIGVDAYPYFQDTMVNAIADGSSLFDDAFGQTQNAVGGKPVWVTETGWPVSGKTSGQAEPSTDNAKAYWDAVGCNTLFGKTNTWWYVLQDAAPDTPNPSFGLVGSTLSTTPLYDLSCSNVTSSSSSSASASASATTTLATVSSSSGASQATSTGSSDTGGSPGISTGSGGGSSGPNQSASPSGSSSGSGSGSGSGSNSSSGSGSGSSGSSGTGSSGSGSNSTTTGSSSTATHTSPPITGAATVQSVGSVLFAAVMAVLAL